MPSVALSFIPPDMENLTELQIFEGPAPTGPFTRIDVVTTVGGFPNYITEFTTKNAIDSNDYFAIQWVDSRGATSEFSTPIPGNTQTLVGRIVDGVRLRNATVAVPVILQEAEAVVSYVFNISNPYSIDLHSVSRLQVTELTNLTFVSCAYVSTMLNISNSSSYSAGLISESASSSNVQTVLGNLALLEKRSLRRLGIGGSRLAGFLPDSSCKVSLTGSKTLIDLSRLLSVKAIITEEILVQDIPTGFVISE